MGLMSSFSCVFITLHLLHTPFLSLLFIISFLPQPPLSSSSFFPRSLKVKYLKQLHSCILYYISLKIRVLYFMQPIVSHVLQSRGVRASALFPHLLKRNSQFTPVVMPLDRLYWDGTGDVHNLFGTVSV